MRARAAPGGATRHSVRPDWAPIAKISVDWLLVVSPIDKAILDEIATLDLALTEHLSVGKPDALGSYTLAL